MDIRTFLATTCWLGWLVFAPSVWASGDLLDRLVAEALGNYPSIEAGQALSRAAQSDLDASQYKFYPNLSVGTQNNKLNYQGSSSSPSIASHNVTLTQPLWSGGALTAGVDRAQARLELARFNVLANKEDIARKLVSAYSEWLRAWLRVLVYEDAVRAHERLSRLITRRFAQGVASEADRGLAESRLQQILSDLASTRSAEASALAVMSQSLGRPVRREELEHDLAKVGQVPDRLTVLDEVLKVHPIIQKLEQEALAAQAEVREARAQLLPQLSFQVQKQMGNPYYLGVQSYTSAGVVMNYNSNAGLSSLALLRSAEDRARSAMLQVDVAKRELTEKLNFEFNDHASAVTRKPQLLRSMALASDLSASYDRQYLVGRKSWLDLLNTVREQLQAGIEMANNESVLIGTSRRLLIYINGIQ